MLESLPQKKPVQGLKTPSGSERPEVEETLQFLKREGVRTMAKDIAKLREQEAIKERERIVKIKTKSAEPATTSSDVGGDEKPKPPLMPHTQQEKPVFVRAKTRSEKILIRAIVIGVLLFILLNGLAFGYWYFTQLTR